MKSSCGRLLEPECCDMCKSDNIKLSKAKNSKFNIWQCLTCDASVTCHADSSSPKGYMASKEIRVLRIKAHDVFDKLWKTGLVHREDAYFKLAKFLKIDFEFCHIGWLSKEHLILTINCCEKLFEKEIKARREALKHKSYQRREFYEKQHKHYIRVRSFRKKRIKAKQ